MRPKCLETHVLEGEAAQAGVVGALSNRTASVAGLAFGPRPRGPSVCFPVLAAAAVLVGKKVPVSSSQAKQLPPFKSSSIVVFKNVPFNWGN